MRRAGRVRTGGGARQSRRFLSPNHEGLPEAEQESRIEHLGESLRWDAEFRERVVTGAARRGLIDRAPASLRLTEAGRELARRTVVR